MKARWGMRNTDAKSTPSGPKTLSATGVPRNPALEQMVP